jgi:hypothetical protein
MAIRVLIADERVLHRNRGLQSVLIVPLTVEGVAVGALRLA